MNVRGQDISGIRPSQGLDVNVLLKAELGPRARSALKGKAGKESRDRHAEKRRVFRLAKTAPWLVFNTLKDAFKAPDAVYFQPCI